jgi:Ribbon-helix-helix protein, copG family
MAKQTKAVRKKSPGGPTGQRNPETIPARLEPEAVAAVEKWAAANNVSRSEAIRRLVELGLTVKTDSPPKSEAAGQGTKQRARDLADAAIHEMTDTTASVNDQSNRRHRLIGGPEEFRGVRRDRPNRK